MTKSLEPQNKPIPQSTWDLVEKLLLKNEIL